MRSGAQITKTPRQWADHCREERRRHLTALLSELRRARESGAEWYRWIAEGCKPLTAEEYAALHSQSAPRASSEQLATSD